ncbi:MAG: GDP-L-fucose synthase family protein, partial [Rhabdaerophilum sp.]
MTLPLRDRRVFVAGHRGMSGQAITRAASRAGAEVLTVSRAEVDLERQEATERYLCAIRPDAVVVAAGKVGGILANNTLRADFIYKNLMIAANVIEASYRAGVKRLVFLGSSCIYPKHAPQPIREEALLTGALEPTNEPYAIAKIAGLKLTESYRRQYGVDYVSVMPTNLYGPGDNYHPEHSHVIAALIRRIHEAKLENKPEVVIWGTGTPRREFLYVDDLAEAVVMVLDRYSEDMHINIGTGEDITITELAQAIAQVVGYSGALVYDRSKPDGTPRKLLDISRIKALGWMPRTPLELGLQKAYADFCAGLGRS